MWSRPTGMAPPATTLRTASQQTAQRHKKRLQISHHFRYVRAVAFSLIIAASGCATPELTEIETVQYTAGGGSLHPSEPRKIEVYIRQNLGSAQPYVAVYEFPRLLASGQPDYPPRWGEPRRAVVRPITDEVARDLRQIARNILTNRATTPNCPPRGEALNIKIVAASPYSTHDYSASQLCLSPNARRLIEVLECAGRLAQPSCTEVQSGTLDVPSSS